MGSVRLGVPENQALRIRDAMGLNWFVETGTYKGATARWAAAHFGNVITIEWYEPRYLATLPSLSPFSNLRAVCGDSRIELARNLPEEPALLWLDAHWCGDYELSVNTLGECPLMEELAAVRPYDALLIDDARLFVGRPKRPHDPAQWPSYDQIRSALPGRLFRVFEDVIYSLPNEYAGVLPYG